MNPRRSARWLRLSGIAAAVAVVLLAIIGSQATPAYAHAALVRSNPANNESMIRPPIRVTLFFSEGLERDLTKIEVLDVDRERVDDGDLRFDDNDPTFASVGLPDLEPGAYFVEYSNVSKVDGHPWSGSYPFVILNSDGSLPAGVDLDNLGGSTSGGTGALPKPFDSALKWFAMISLATVAGASFFVVAVMRPAARFLDDPDRERVTDTGEQWVVNLAHVLLPASFIAAALLVLLAVSRFDTSTSLMDYLTEVRAGQYRALLLALLVVALAGTDLLFLSRGRGKRNVGIVLLIAATAAALFTYSMISHGAADEGKFWSVTSDYLHLGASAIWLGMLVMLPPLLSTRALGDGQRRFLFQANAFDRFSVAAGISVIVVLASGVFNSFVEIPTWSALVDTTYGRVLLVKLGLVALLLPVAGLNAFFLKPRLVRAIDDTYGGTGRPPAGGSDDDTLGQLERWLPRTIIVEIILVLAVFASVAVLTQTSTAEGEIAQEQAQKQASAVFKQTASVDGLNLALEITPNLVGRNQYSLVVTDDTGAPYDAITQARLRFTAEIPGLALPPSEIILNRFGPGDFRGEGSYFTQAGNWRVEAGLRRTGADDISRTYIDGVLSPARVASSEGGAFALPFDSLSWTEVTAAFLALVGVVLLLYRREFRSLAPSAGRVTLSAAAIFLIGAGVLWFGFADEHGSANLLAGNPVKPTEESVASGRELFQQNCVVCHGADGRGDGPAAADLNPQPTDFRLHMPNHTDPEFFKFIADGYPGTAMPEFRDSFSEQDIWNLVNFLRASFSEAPSQ